MDLLTASAEGTSVGYPLLFFGVLLGSVVPVVPTGAVVGSAAAFAMTSNDLGLPTVLALAALAALLGDLITFAVCRFGGPAAVRRIARGQHTERLEEVREQFRRHGWQIIVVGRLLPAGRIPVLLAAGALSYPWKRLVPAQFVAALLWALAYALLGVISGGVFDSPLVAVLIATLLVLLVGAVLNTFGARRRRRLGTPDAAPDRVPAPEPAPSEVR
ncbi:membrane protein DedA, SNARE-associated domain [Blastococcus aggregatus]|uniref:Membrane protein DedA, SNARE-associated domain n=1 Tax=Blastococcus aggregatus TaxID=38502 RepID=A0A285V0U2_9ACTN|nr:VTT domain-containing protein [Blastococcus aggregatus]SOC47775.1 membrane protein DedA, SNARE-associated domain [Blastococcus aggregatus]